MNPQLHKLLVELDYKFDEDLNDYFTLEEVSKEEIVSAIVAFFIPYVQSQKQAIYNLIIALRIMIDEYEFYEEYEKADIFERTRKRFEKMTFSIY